MNSKHSTRSFHGSTRLWSSQSHPQASVKNETLPGMTQKSSSSLNVPCRMCSITRPQSNLRSMMQLVLSHLSNPLAEATIFSSFWICTAQPRGRYRVNLQDSVDDRATPITRATCSTSTCSTHQPVHRCSLMRSGTPPRCSSLLTLFKTIRKQSLVEKDQVRVGWQEKIATSTMTIVNFWVLQSINRLRLTFKMALTIILRVDWTRRRKTSKPQRRLWMEWSPSLSFFTSVGVCGRVVGE